MYRHLRFVTLFIIILTAFQGCTSTNNKKRENQESVEITASILVAKMAEAVNPEGKLDHIDTLQCKALYTRINNQNENKLEYKYELYEINKPDIIVFKENEIISYDYKKTEKKIKVVVRKQETTVTVTKNGELLQNHIDKPTLNKYKEMALSFKNRLFFGFNNKTLSKKISNKIYLIDNSKCYRLSMILKDAFFDDNSNKITVYVDCNTFLTKKIVSKDSEVMDIIYENIDGVVLPIKYKIQTNHPFGKQLEKIYYAELEQFELNKKIDISKYMEPVQGRKI